MKFTADTKTLKKALDYSALIIDKKTSLPILRTIHLEAIMPDTIRVYSTDLEVLGKFEFTGDVQESGDICIDLANLKKIVDKSKTDFLPFESIDNSKLKVGKYSLNALSSDDYPILPDPVNLLSINFAISDLEKIHKAISTDEVRHYLNGFFIDRENIIATDGHRLHGIKRENNSIDQGKGIILPAKFAKILLNAKIKKAFTSLKAQIQTLTRNEINKIKQANFKYSQANQKEKVHEFTDLETKSTSFAYIDDGEISGHVGCRAIDDDYPDYHQVIPENHPEMAMIDNKALVESLVESLVLFDAKTLDKGVKLTMNGSIQIDANNPEMGDYHSDLPGEYTGDETLIMGLNIKYLQDAIAHVTAEFVCLETGTDLEPVVVTDGDFFAVVMPTRV